MNIVRAAHTDRSDFTLLRRALVLVVGIVSAILISGTSPVWAYHQANNGTPGAVTVYRAQGFHVDQCVGLGFSCFNPDVVVPGPTVYRSSRTTGAQDVAVVTTIQVWNGSAWASLSHNTTTYRIPAGQNGIQLPRRDFMVSRGYYRVGFAFAWAVANGGVGLGSKAVAMDQVGDCTCTGKFASTACDASGGWLYLVAGTMY